MIAFAANSVLCRYALGAPDIDAASFTAIRLGSGALALLIILRFTEKSTQHEESGSWTSAAALFAYAVLFSFAYLRLAAGTGSLILFAMVQTTMITWAIVQGERPRAPQWLGLAAALGGLLYLVAPGLSAPPIAGSLMMGGAGVAWGVYSLRGRQARDPAVVTTGNFVRAAPLAMLCLALLYKQFHASPRGIVLAIASGALASGVGYIMWYAALKHLSATRAASVQLTVPVITALAGLVFLAEPVTLRLAVATVLILGGVGLTLSRGRSTAS